MIRGGKTRGGGRPAARTPARAAARGLAGAALLIAAVTVLARLVGFGRWLVFSQTVGESCLGDVYNTANLLPNVMFEVVAGGALASVVVPVIAGPLVRGEREDAARTVSALLTWTLGLLLPVALLAAVFARPLVGFFLGPKTGCDSTAVDVGTRMLLVFLPQLFCYALAVIFSGVLQAHRRFLASAAAPLVSSAVVISAYLLFTAVAGVGADLGAVSLPAEVVLSGGTTLGVAALALTVVLPMRGTGLRLRPSLAFPSGVAVRVRALALAGIAVLVAQQLAALAVNWLANHHGDAGSVTRYVWAWAVFLLPYAVLAVPIATSAFPRLSAAFDGGDPAEQRAVLATTTRAVVLVSCAGAALLTATAVPVARVFQVGPGVSQLGEFAAAITAFAPGLLGYGLVAHLGRALYAAHRGRRAAVVTVAGWVVVVAADVVLVLRSDPASVVAALGLGNTAGMTVAGGLLLAAVRGALGAAALREVGRTLLTGVVAAVLAAATGRLLAWGLVRGLDWGLADSGLLAAMLGALGLASVAAVVFGVVAYVADRPTAAMLLRLRGVGG
jgi:putative peptidoglycan lipid II flippase